jgi:hypothetical protein
MREPSTVRRSFAVPRSLLDEAVAAAPPELRGNLNSLVKEALRVYVARQREIEFTRAMESMARDPGIQRESKAIDEHFQAAEADGL